jgi:hypothetical protein
VNVVSTSTQEIYLKKINNKNNKKQQNKNSKNKVSKGKRALRVGVSEL